MVELGTLALDGTRLRANASRHKAMSYGRMVRAEAELETEIAWLRKNINKLLKEAEATDALEDERFGADHRGDELPLELRRREQRLGRIREAKQALEREAQAIVVAEVSNQAADAPLLGDALAQLDENLEAIEAALPEGAALTTDAGYFSKENVKTCEQHGLDPYIATGRFKHQEPQPLASRGPIPKDATPKQRMARKIRTKKGRAIYSRRKVIVEPVFGQIHIVQDGRHLLLRGMSAARAQWRFHCGIHNLLKLHRAGGLALLGTG
jgi:hypothetical protein